MTHDEIHAKLKTGIARSLFNKATLKAGFIFRHQAYWGSFKRGYLARRDEQPRTAMPYKIKQGRLPDGRFVTFNAAHRRYWFLGWDFAFHLEDPNLRPAPIQMPGKGIGPKPAAPAAASRKLLKP